MINKVDVDSAEFRAEKEKTAIFVAAVQAKRGWVPHPDEKINESILVGLTRNKLIYGTRYCPCFMVEGSTKDERRAADNRICPCKPAIAEEMQQEGRCHCGIYCTPEYAQNFILQDEAELVAHDGTAGLSAVQSQALLKQESIDEAELQALLEARRNGAIEFNLIDVREWNEWLAERIVGTDHLAPTTSFYEALEEFANKKTEPVILYCFLGSRSAHCQKVMKDLGFTTVTNLHGGIKAWHGPTEAGE